MNVVANPHINIKIIYLSICAISHFHYIQIKHKEDGHRKQSDQKNVLYTI